nr:hypothetical protein [Peribacillus simplex]
MIKYYIDNLKKIKRFSFLKEHFGLTNANPLIDECRLLVEIEVDGGNNLQSVQACVEAGANVLVAGSAIYNADNRISAIE